MADLKIALAMISNDKPEVVYKYLDSTKDVFDVYCLQHNGESNETIKQFKKWCKEHDKECYTGSKKLGKGGYPSVVVNGKRILADFAAARNDSFKLVSKSGADFVFWMDTDDVLVNPEGIHKVAQHMDKEGIQAAIMTYIYAKGNGNIKPVVQKRERLMDVRVPGKWVDMVHEGYQFDNYPTMMEVEDVLVEHERETGQVIDTGRRNHLIMKKQLKRDGLKNLSDKVVHNLAFDHWEHRELKDAIRYYKLFIKRGLTLPDQAYNAYVKLADSYFSLGKLSVAAKYAFKTLEIDSGRADPYLILAKVSSASGNWQEVVHYADKIIAIGVPHTTDAINEADYTILPMRLKVHALLQQGNVKGAHEVAEEIYKILPTNEALEEVRAIKGDLVGGDVAHALQVLATYYQENNMFASMDRLKDTIPLELLDAPAVRQLVQQMMKDYNRKARSVRLSGKKSIVIWVGPQAIEPWNGRSDVTRGVGGSEGMTIQLARELAALGNDVVVYNDCGEDHDKKFDGVLYRNFNTWSEEMKCDVFVSLRRPEVFQKMISAKKQYLWLHDTEYGSGLPKTLFYTPNKVIVLSEAHKAVIKQSHNIHHDDIFWLTRNGINPLALQHAKKEAGKRNPYQIIWASSYDRGLDFVLENWHKVREAVPQAELKIFYGWNTYDSLMQARQGTPRGDEMKAYKAKMIDIIAKSDGVQELGRVSQSELYKHFAESSIWYYPTAFYEISCINAMTAQALGCVPVCTPYAALSETVSSKYGIKLSREHIVDGLIYNLQHQEELEERRKPMAKWALKQYSMKGLAKEWDNFFNND